MTLMIDLAIIVLLVAALAYGVVITRRVRRLMGMLEQLQPLVAQFSAAVDKSEASVDALRGAAAEAAGAEAGAAVAPASASASASAAKAPAKAGSRAAALSEELARETAATREDLDTAGLGGVAFASRRTSPKDAPAKSDLVRSFFEQTRAKSAW